MDFYRIYLIRDHLQPCDLVPVDDVAQVAGVLEEPLPVLGHMVPLAVLGALVRIKVSHLKRAILALYRIHISLRLFTFLVLNEPKGQTKDIAICKIFHKKNHKTKKNTFQLSVTAGFGRNLDFDPNPQSLYSYVL